ncbi:plasma protease C1 inhibitor isoform X2 [Brachyhypopomus gauderio]|uniref:plasma protease C1 inhibitor isoform X2 n=1 Tax=Brachyhypopomus gauderio TaxID=698409 RepID=UPI0040418AC3
MLGLIIVLLLHGFSGCLSDISIPVGSSLTLPCLASLPDDLLFPKYTWTFTPDQQRDEDVLKHEPWWDVSEAELALQAVSLRHAGEYTCVVEAQSGDGLLKMETRFVLHIQEIPLMMRRLVLMETEGETVMLPCHPVLTSGNVSSARPVWYRMTEGSGHQEVHPVLKSQSSSNEADIATNRIYWTHDPKEQDWSIMIADVRLEDAGLYACDVNTESEKKTVSLQLMVNGARGKTRTELESALSLPTEFSCIHLMMKKMRNESKESMVMAHQMFYNPEYEIKDTFVNQSMEFYDTEPEKLTNSSEKNVNMVNDWVSSKTNNKISQLIESVDPNTQFILLNAVYFIGKWKGSFDFKSKRGSFSTLSGEVVSVPILYSTKFELAISYMPSLKAQVARFPLTDHSSLYMVVPTTVSEEAFSLVEVSMTDKTIFSLVTQMESVPSMVSEVTLPKIKLMLNTDLISLLKKIGLFELFGDPNLCGMFPDHETVVLTDARHRAFLSLTEKGVEAAAASSISFSRSFSSFSAMKPFIFIVWSEQINCPLFMGRVLNPQQKD